MRSTPRDFVTRDDASEFQGLESLCGEFATSLSRRDFRWRFVSCKLAEQDARSSLYQAVLRAYGDPARPCAIVPHDLALRLPWQSDKGRRWSPMRILYLRERLLRVFQKCTCSSPKAFGMADSRIKPTFARIVRIRYLLRIGPCAASDIVLIRSRCIMLSSSS